MENEKKKRTFLSFEVTSELKNEITKQAKQKGVNRSEYIRNAIFEYMNK